MLIVHPDSKTICRTSRIVGLCANVLEHQDRALFPLLAPFIASYFFPVADRITALVDIYGVIVFSLFMRPLGSLFFGWLGDRKGRKSSLLLSLYGMSMSTIAIGFIPSHTEIGSFSPLLLLMLRCSQNFFGAGEAISGGIYVMEHTKKGKQGFISAIFEASTMLGVLIASLQTALIAYFGLLYSHWQWLFYVSGALGLFFYFLRKRSQESPEFISTPEGRFSWLMLWQERKPLFAVAVTTGFGYATYLLSIRFMNTYLQATTDINAAELTSVNTLLSLLDLMILPLFGLAALYVPASALMSASAITTGIFSLPLFIWMMSTKTLPVILFVRLIIVIFGVIFAAPYRAWLQALVGPEKRCMVLNVGSAMGQLCVEGPLTLLSLLMIRQGGEWIPGVCLALLGFGSAYVIRQMHMKR
jgi:MFS family permease